MLTLFRIKNVAVRLHYSSVVLFGYIVWACAPLWEIFYAKQNFILPIEYVISTAFALALFSNILAHEVAHAIANNKVGIKTESVFFFFIGAGTYSEGNFQSPKQELISASAGLIVSMVLALISLGFYFFGKKIFGFTFLNSKIQTFIFFLFYFNLLCVIVNVIPAFPTDGGRILRALLWIWNRNQVRATLQAVIISYSLISLLGVVTILSNENLALKIWVSIVIVFTFLGAKIELEMTTSRKTEKEILEEYKKRVTDIFHKEIPNEIILL